jgi:hypothetical protein
MTELGSGLMGLLSSSLTVNCLLSLWGTHLDPARLPEQAGEPIGVCLALPASHSDLDINLTTLDLITGHI